jgi:NAD(P)-dependent dehydrogenase (short-subunit alcohol dehydrogenase family)
MADHNEDHGRSAASELKSAAVGKLMPLVCDVSDERAVEACVKTSLATFGRLDIIVNNAAVMAFKPLGDCTREDWLKVLGVDLLGPAFFTTQAFRHMKDGGSIVNVSSIHAVTTTADVAPYAASKAALLSLTRSAAIEGKPRNIRANAVLPGAIETPMLAANPNIKSGAERLDPAYVGTPRDIADAVAFLAGDEARFITGASLVVDGGRLVRL